MSLALVVSYLRLVVGMRFAAVEAGLTQFLYLVLFSYAFFFKGFTGLTVTIGAILTLFVAMQLTGRIRWSERLAGRVEPRMSASYNVWIVTGLLARLRLPEGPRRTAALAAWFQSLYPDGRRPVLVGGAAVELLTPVGSRRRRSRLRRRGSAARSSRACRGWDSARRDAAGSSSRTGLSWTFPRTGSRRAGVA